MVTKALFFDGNNFYHSFREFLRKKHVDMSALARVLLGGPGIKYYYTALPEGLTVHEGFLKTLERGGWRVRRGRIVGNKEKESDVALAVDLVLWAAKGLPEAVVASGDGDLVPAVKAARKLGTRVKVAAFKPYLSHRLAEAADEVLYLDALPWEELLYGRAEQEG